MGVGSWEKPSRPRLMHSSLGDLSAVVILSPGKYSNSTNARQWASKLGLIEITTGRRQQVGRGEGRAVSRD